MAISYSFGLLTIVASWICDGELSQVLAKLEGEEMGSKMNPKCSKGQLFSTALLLEILMKKEKTCTCVKELGQRAFSYSSLLPGFLLGFIWVFVVCCLGFHLDFGGIFG